MNEIETVLEFMNRINQRDVDKLAELMSEDHIFADSLGNQVKGREKMRRLARILRHLPGLLGLARRDFPQRKQRRGIRRRRRHHQREPVANPGGVAGGGGPRPGERVARLRGQQARVRHTREARGWGLGTGAGRQWLVSGFRFLVAGHWHRPPPAACRPRQPVSQLTERSVWQTRAARHEPRAPARSDPSA